MTRSWMRPAVLATACGAALALAVSPPLTRADEVGAINGEAEAPAIRRVIDALALQAHARGLVDDVADRSRLDAGLSTSLGDALAAARAAVADARTLVDRGTGYQATTDADFAFDALTSADAALGKLAGKLAKPQRAKSVRKTLDKAGNALLAAKLSMQGIFVEPKDDLAPLQALVPLPAWFDDFDRPSIGAVVKLLRATAPSAKGAPARSASKKVRRNAAAAARQVAATDAKVTIAKRKSTARAKAGKAPVDGYVAISAASKKQAAPGSCTIGLGRTMRAAFVTGGTLGLLNPKRRDPSEQAFACLEVEIPGSAPREHVRVCARVTEGGVQMFGETTGGQALRQRELPGVSVVDVRIEYDGVNFRISARPEGATPGEYVLVDTVHRPLGSDAWTVAIGGGGLTGKAEVGLDRVYIVAP